MMNSYFVNLFRFFTSDDSIVSEVSQQKAATKEVDPSSGVKKVAIQNDDDEPFQSDINALVENYGALFQGMVIEIDLQTMLEICPRQRRRSDAYNSLVNYLGREHGVTLLIQSRKSIKQQEHEQE